MDDPAVAPLKLKGLHRAATRSDDTSFTSPSQDVAPGICRICRGEATPEEPLFYPCKCSGSIKYVHQDCLMEWLSHSQKKYCELCKTSFRFTKLYAPDMPQSLPVHVFLGHMAKYLFRNILVWVRAAVAISVWVFCLPYFMRSVWSFLFWVSDEGLGTGSLLPRNNDSAVATFELASEAFGINTCPATPLLEPTTTPASAAEVLLDGASGQNMSEMLIRILIGSLGGLPSRWDRSGGISPNAANATANSNLPGTNPSSLLGEVVFLQTLTRNSTVNRVLVSILEGQIITILVIICFILVILVRDYVIQQQPEINMRAAFAAPVNPLPAMDQLDIRQGDIENLRGPDESDDETIDDERLGGTEPINYFNGPPPNDDYERRAQQFDNLLMDQALAEPPGPFRSGGTHPENELLRGLPSVSEYERIYSRANGDPNRFRELIREEGMIEERLPYLLDLGARHNSHVEATAGPSGPSFSSNIGDTTTGRPESSGSTAGSSSRIAYTPGSSDQASRGSPEPSTSRKGKEREMLPAFVGPQEDDPWAMGLSPGPSRPRAVSDGPQLHDSVHPLANNSWSFAGLNTEPEPQITYRGSMADAMPPHLMPAFTGIPESDAASHSNPQAMGITQSSFAAPGTLPLPPPEEPSDEIAADEVESSHHEQDEVATSDVDAQDPGLMGRVTDFMWGNLDNEGAVLEAENVLAGEINQDDDDQDDGFFGIDDPDDLAEPNGNRNGQVGANGAGGNAAVDAEAIDDLEDFEGVMELVGMRGPIAGLFQNAIFCAVLVSMTILTCLFIPYNIGRISVWIVANPMRLVRLLFELSKLLQDAAVLFAGIGSWIVLNLVDIFTGMVGGVLASHVVTARKASWALWTSAGSRVLEYAFMDFPLSASEMQNFSAISHGALLSIKVHVGSVLSAIKNTIVFLLGGYSVATELSLETLSSGAKSAWAMMLCLSSILTNPSTWVIDLGESENASAVNPEWAYWSGIDRFWAILAGYTTIFFLGAMYLKRGSPFLRGNMWEAGFIDTLHQASGIMKVIMIISIEMLIFPLYCGLLLDGALLPLFENTTFKSRMLFTYNYPLTSVFVHWFVGTGYMFHFALFVSMCRKIMRQGVLYFIRDPDDPEFHPVRDVLEKNLTTQLRKILFSAFVYGALVIVCLGGVVWGLSYTMPNVLPIHYSSNEPVLEFPVDLLFYNFLMPLAVNFFKPGDGLHTMYTWWFRTCAGFLRLTFFLFGERRLQEEGTLLIQAGSPLQQLPWYQKRFLTLDSQRHVVPMNVYNLSNENGTEKKEADLIRIKTHLRETNQLVESGRFVRAPASDRIRIPKGKKVFLEVNESGQRLDGRSDTDLYATDQYQKVYIPPNFRMRVFLFILFIWVFAAVTGVGFTIIPLVFGRKMFKLLIPDHIRTNDIYAFSIGVYVLGTLAYSIYRIRQLLAKVKRWATATRRAVANGRAGKRVFDVLAHGLRLLYAYFFLLIAFPLLVSIMMELYLSIPLHTYMYPPTAATIEASRAGGPEASRHTVRVIQAWTLGVLYLKLAVRTVPVLFPNTRLTTALQSVLRRDWLHPDVSILTRAFVIPGLAISTLAIIGPPICTGLLIKYGILSGPNPEVNEAAEAARLAIVYRQSYPILALTALVVKNTIGLVKVFNGWTARIRDEAYLIGERLHNFGAAAAGTRRVRGAWRAGGARL